MRKLINVAIQNPLISGSGVIFLGSLLANPLNFLFNLFMTKNLTVADYGTLASLISLSTLATIPAGSMSPTIIKFAASYFAKGELDMVKGLFFKVSRLAVSLGLIVFLIFVIVQQQINQFFHIGNGLLVLLAGVLVAFNFISVPNQPILQAKLAFRFISFNAIFGALLKLLFGILLVSLGFSVWGALLALTISSVIPYLFSFTQLTFLLKKEVQNPHISIKKLISYGIPSTITLFALTAFTSTDIILVKHFFNTTDAGLYAGVSLIGRIVFFLSAPIGTVMFPLIVQKHTRKENFHTDFRIAMLLVIVPSCFVIVLYYFIPDFVLTVSTKKEFTSVSSLLWLFGIFSAIYGLLTVMTNFYLSIEKTKIFIPIGMCAILQVVLLWFFHETFLQVLTISLVITSLLLFGLLLYYWKLYGKNTR
ncbi:MAG: oligosaccharide flippase family protein [Candidatus Levyibacteriota bacterium]|nr:MAG: oligosaccharide flippase family protein [Candidatus Levybacteria bacterium]